MRKTSLAQVYRRPDLFFSATNSEVSLFLNPAVSELTMSVKDRQCAERLWHELVSGDEDPGRLVDACIALEGAFLIDGKSAADMLHVAIVSWPSRTGDLPGFPASAKRIGGVTGVREAIDRIGEPVEQETWPRDVRGQLAIESDVSWWGNIGLAESHGRITHVLIRGPVRNQQPAKGG